MGEHEKPEESSFKIVDKRRFTSTGETRTDVPPRDDVRRPAVELRPAEPARDKGSEPPRSGDPRAARPADAKRAPPADKSGIDFLQFIASLATSAMAAMGMLPEARGRGMPVNLEHAREYIGVISMLQDRTRGNLSQEEDEALARLLSDLRLQFIEVSKAPPAAAGRPARPPRA